MLAIVWTTPVNAMHVVESHASSAITVFCFSFTPKVPYLHIDNFHTALIKEANYWNKDVREPGFFKETIQSAVIAKSSLHYTNKKVSFIFYFYKWV